VKLLWTVGARADLLEVFSYVADEDIDAAVRLRNRLRGATKTLVVHPEIGRMVPELGNPALRELIVRPYRVVYAVRENEVHVLGVVHSRMLLPSFEGEAP